jgi:thioredoxin-like negative regulator of GroEL
MDLATVYMAQHRPSEAVPIYQAYMCKHPGNSTALFKLGMALKENNELVSARDCFDVVSKSSDESLSAQAMKEIGAIDQQSSTPVSQASPWPDSASTPQRPDQPTAAPIAGEVAGALEGQSNTAKNAPLTFTGMLKFVVGQMQIGNYSGALQSLRCLNSKHPNDAQVHYLTAVCLVQTRQLNSAVSEYNKTMQLSSSGALTRLAATGIKKLQPNPIPVASRSSSTPSQ